MYTICVHTMKWKASRSLGVYLNCKSTIACHETLPEEENLIQVSAVVYHVESINQEAYGKPEPTPICFASMIVDVFLDHGYTEETVLT